jgi:hypothetical protein
MPESFEVLSINDSVQGEASAAGDGSQARRKGVRLRTADQIKVLIPIRPMNEMPGKFGAGRWSDGGDQR